MTTGLFQPPPSAAVDRCTAELAVAFQRQIDAGTIKIYRETLSDLPLWAIQEAALRLRRKGGEFFPPAPVWHQVAEEVIAERLRETLARPRHDESPECDECRDTGWCDVDRDGRSVCVPCSCRATNANYQRMTASSRKAQNEEVKR